MPEFFLQLKDKDRKAILDKAAQDLGRRSNILEKDVWVCWTLEKLAEMPGVPPFAFKGGTSLSKAYDAIARFSEDVDVTIDRRTLGPELDPFSTPSRRQTSKACAQLKALLEEFIDSELQPYFQKCLTEELADDNVSVQIEGTDNDTLIIPYPSCLDGTASYVTESIRLELGGLNEISPSTQIKLVPYIQQYFPSLEFPVPSVPVLVPERTYWEKATLIHNECNRERIKTSADRMSRHWYDLFQLNRSEIGERALENLALLKDVVNQKQVLYYRAGARYEDCFGKINLVPEKSSLLALRADFDQMITNGMFWEEPAIFSEIIDELSELESAINSKF